jgi:hypothetical protein
MYDAHPVTDHLGENPDVLVLLAPALGSTPPPSFALPSSAEVRELASPVKRPGEHDAVLLVARDLLDLRRAASALANLGVVARVGVWLEREVSVLPTVAPRPEWPPVEEIVACRRGQSHVLVTFASPVPARQVLLEIARAAGQGHTPSTAWPMLGVRRDEPWLWPPADPAATVAMPARLFDTSVDSPPDLVLTHDAAVAPETFSVEPHPVLGRAPSAGEIGAPLSWEQVGALRPDEAEAALAGRGPVSLGAFDERVINPIGFDRTPAGDAARLVRGPGTVLIAKPATPGHVVQLDGDQGLSDTDLRQLRRIPGLELAWEGGWGPQHYCRLVVGLAMAGTPLVSGEPPQWARLLLPEEIINALTSPVDLSDRLSREEHSIRLRRAALRHHTTDSWRRTLARVHGLQESPAPGVSVLLVTRRPEMVPFALRQLARQREADFEVILAAHGFEADPDVLDWFREHCPAPLTAFIADPGTLFGEVLNQAASRATGDVLLKMDDDDWYGPEFIADLLLARGYSGAEIVGCPPEFTFVEPLWLTTRRPDDTEVYRPFVAGGTMLIDRAAFRSLGGFRHTKKYVDANLLSAVISAGGSVYRTHGLGYVLRRGSQGHTWDPGLGYFVTRKRSPEQWRGFRPSSLLEASSADLPAKPEDERVSP